MNSIIVAYVRVTIARCPDARAKCIVKNMLTSGRTMSEMGDKFLKSSGESIIENMRHWLKRHPISYLSLVVVAVFLIMNASQGKTYSGLAIQAIILSLIVILSLFLFDTRCLATTSQQDRKFVIRKSIYLLFVALVASVALYLVLREEKGSYQEEWLAQIVPFVGMCLFTGVFEEGLFRGVIFRTMCDGLAGKKNSLLKAAVISSFLFGVLHVTSGGGAPVALSDPITVGQMILKPIQAALFGFCMAALFARVKSIWLVSLVHGVNNMLMMGPLVLFNETITLSYLSGNVFDLVILAGTVVLYIPMTIGAVKLLKGASQF